MLVVRRGLEELVKCQPYFISDQWLPLLVRQKALLANVCVSLRVHLVFSYNVLYVHASWHLWLFKASPLLCSTSPTGWAGCTRSDLSRSVACLNSGVAVTMVMRCGRLSFQISLRLRDNLMTTFCLYYL